MVDQGPNLLYILNKFTKLKLTHFFCQIEQEKDFESLREEKAILLDRLNVSVSILYSKNVQWYTVILCQIGEREKHSEIENLQGEVRVSFCVHAQEAM